MTARVNVLLVMILVLLSLLLLIEETLERKAEEAAMNLSTGFEVMEGVKGAAIITFQNPVEQRRCLSEVSKKWGDLCTYLCCCCLCDNKGPKYSLLSSHPKNQRDTSYNITCSRTFRSDL